MAKKKKQTIDYGQVMTTAAVAALASAAVSYLLARLFATEERKQLAQCQAVLAQRDAAIKTVGLGPWQSG